MTRLEVVLCCDHLHHLHHLHYSHLERMFCCCPVQSVLHHYWWGSLRHFHCVSYGNISHSGLDLKTWERSGPTGQPSVAQSCFFSLPGGSHHPCQGGETWCGHSTPPGRPRTRTWPRSCWTRWDWDWPGVTASCGLAGCGFLREFSPSRGYETVRLVSWSRISLPDQMMEGPEDPDGILVCQFENHILKSLHSNCAAINKLFNLQDLRIRMVKSHSSLSHLRSEMLTCKTIKLTVVTDMTELRCRQLGNF